MPIIDMKQNISKLKNLATNWNYEADTKRQFHILGRQLLKTIETVLPLQEYKIYSVLGGPGVLGEVVLHTPEYYIQIFQGTHSYGNVLYRRCYGMKDYGNHMDTPNHYTHIETLGSPLTFAQLLEKI